MGFLDRFRSAAPQTTAIGESGRLQKSGFLSEDDHNLELTGIRGVRELERMHRADADARKATRMVANPILAATWAVVPFGDDEASVRDREIARAVEHLLFEHLGWRAHLYTALDVALPAGHAPFETVWELVEWEGRELWACRLDLRLPRSLWRFEQDDAGRLESVQQMTRRGLQSIPAEQLVYYRLGARGDNWRGESLLRPAYRSFWHKEKLEHIAAMAAERFAMGTPVGYPPQGAGDDEREALAEILANMRAGESGYIVSPWPHAQWASPGQGAVIEIVQASGEGFDIEPLLKYHSDKIAAAVLQEFMRLGQSGVGARATADVQQDPFLAFCEVLCGVLVEATINEQLIPRLVALNFPDAEGLPRLRASLIDRTSVTELADAAQKLTAAGLLVADTPLEDWMREYLGLPAADPAEREQRKADADAAREARVAGERPDDEENDDEDGDEPAGLRALRRQDRPLRGWEALMQLDRVEGAIDGARDRLLAAAAPVTHQAAAAIGRGENPDAEELRAVIAEELAALYWTGRDTVRAELDAQRPGLAASWPALLDDEQDVPGELRMRAELAAENIIAAMVSAARRETLTRSATTAASLQAAAEAAARGALRTEAQLNAAPALNAGRRAEADEHDAEIRGARYTSILDGGRCPACQTADDDILRPLDDPVRLERIPPNPACHGGDRCRCLEWFELLDESPPSA